MQPEQIFCLPKDAETQDKYVCQRRCYKDGDSSREYGGKCVRHWRAIILLQGLQDPDHELFEKGGRSRHFTVEENQEEEHLIDVKHAENLVWDYERTTGVNDSLRIYIYFTNQKIQSISS